MFICLVWCELHQLQVYQHCSYLQHVLLALPCNLSYPIANTALVSSPAPCHPVQTTKMNYLQNTYNYGNVYPSRIPGQYTCWLVYMLFYCTNCKHITHMYFIPKQVKVNSHNSTQIIIVIMKIYCWFTRKACFYT